MKSNHIKILLSSILAAILIWTIYFIIHDQKERGYAKDSQEEVPVELYTDQVTQKKYAREVSPDYFDPLGEGYTINQGKIYFEKKLVASAEPYNFQRHPGQPTLGPGVCGGPSYWTDGTEIFYEGRALGANTANFTINIGHGFKCYLIGYAWDWNKVFYQGKEIEGIDAKSFKVIQSTFARDAYRAYQGGRVMIGNPDEIEKGIIEGSIQPCEPFSGC